MTEPDQPENQMEQFPPHNPSEAGAINMAELVNRASEVISITVNAGRVAYHGLSEVISMTVNAGRVAYHEKRAGISQKRMEMAGSRLDRMDHKDLLYGERGELYDVLSWAARAPFRIVHRDPLDTIAPNIIKPGNPLERFMIHRLERKLTKQELSIAERKRTNTAFGGPKAETIRLLPRILTTAGRSEIGRRTRTERGYWSADDPDPRRRRNALNTAKAEPAHSEKPRQKKERKKVEQRTDEYITASVQPKLRRFRRLRRDGKIVRGERYGGAINDIKRHHHRAEKHRKKREDLLI